MANCEAKSGAKINASLWPPSAQIGYAKVEEDACHETVYGLQVGIYNDFQNALRGLQIGLFNRGEDVEGLAIGAVNAHERITGMHVGLWNYAKKEAKTVGVGLVNESDGDLIGGHIGLYNHAREIMKGFQFAILNAAGTNNRKNHNIAMNGFQVGLVNRSERLMEGFQLGIVNGAEFTMTGFQIAGVNIAGGTFVGGMHDGLHLGVFNYAAHMNAGTVGIINFSEQCKYFTPLIGASCLFGPAERGWFTVISE